MREVGADMLDVSRYMLEIKDSNKYLFDKFLSKAQAWSCLNWPFNADLYCDRGCII